MNPNSLAGMPKWSCETYGVTGRKRKHHLKVVRCRSSLVAFGKRRVLRHPRLSNTGRSSLLAFLG